MQDCLPLPSILNAHPSCRRDISVGCHCSLRHFTYQLKDIAKTSHLKHDHSRSLQCRRYCLHILQSTFLVPGIHQNHLGKACSKAEAIEHSNEPAVIRLFVSAYRRGSWLGHLKPHERGLTKCRRMNPYRSKCLVGVFFFEW